MRLHFPQRLEQPGQDSTTTPGHVLHVIDLGLQAVKHVAINISKSLTMNAFSMPLIISCSISAWALEICPCATAFFLRRAKSSSAAQRSAVYADADTMMYVSIHEELSSIKARAHANGSLPATKGRKALQHSKYTPPLAL